MTPGELHHCNRVGCGWASSNVAELFDHLRDHLRVEVLDVASHDIEPDITKHVVHGRVAVPMLYGQKVRWAAYDAVGPTELELADGTRHVSDDHGRTWHPAVQPDLSTVYVVRRRGQWHDGTAIVGVWRDQESADDWVRGTAGNWAIYAVEGAQLHPPEK